MDWNQMASIVKRSQALEIDPPHLPNDDAKVRAIAASLQENGWQGVPLLYWEGKYLNGSHRYAAIAECDWDLEIPIVDAQMWAEELFGAGQATQIEEMIEDGSSIWDAIDCLDFKQWQALGLD